VKHIVMFSGGMGSYLTAKMVVEKYGSDDVVLLFADTMMEDEDLYRFMEDAVKVLGVPLTRIADGRSVWEVFNDVKFLGNSRIDPCSRVLKRELLDKWIKKNFEPDECVIYMGIDWGEKHRYERLVERKLPYIYKAPMVEEEIMPNREQKMEILIKDGIKPPRLYGYGFAHNNCGGFCVKAGLAQFRKLYEVMPERYEWHVQMEKRHREKVPKSRPFLKKTTNGVKRYLWLEEYREEYLEKSIQPSLDEEFDWGGCGCAID